MITPTVLGTFDLAVIFLISGHTPMQVAADVTLPLLVALVTILTLLYAARQCLPLLYAWNMNSGWGYASWYSPPAPGTVRAWIERPRLQRIGAWFVSALGLYAAVSLLHAVGAVVLIVW